MRTRGERSQSTGRHWPERLTRIAFFVALTVVLGRGLVLESLRDPFEVMPGAEPVPRGAGPATGVVLDWLSVLPAVLVLLRVAIDRTFRLRAAWSVLPIAALALWAMLSVLWSDDRFAAVVGASHFIAGVALLFAASQLVRSWLQLRLVAAAYFGLMLALTAHGLVYRFIEVPDLRRTVEKDRERILRERGWESGSFMERQFFKKVSSGEMVGMTASPNTLAAVLVLMVIVSAGIAIQRFADGDAPAWASLVILPLPLVAVVIFLTRSRAAIATSILAAALLIVVAFTGDFLQRHRKAVFAAMVGIVLSAMLVVIGFGLRHNHLGHDSLTFRWRYWVGAARVIAQHPVLGVGWNNFGAHYLAVREPVASEEIKDPHNILVRFTSELGCVGGALAVAWLVWVWWELTRPHFDVVEPEHSNSALATVMKLATFATALSTVAAVDFSQSADWVLIEVIKRLLFGGLLLGGLIIGSFVSFEKQELDDRPAPLLLTAMIIAAGIFLLHNVIDFSLFESGAMGVFMLTCGSVLGIRAQSDRAARQPVRAGALAIAAATWLGLTAAVMVPILIAESRAQAGDESIRVREFRRAATQFGAADDALPFTNTDYVFRAARAQVFAGAPPGVVRETLARAVNLNPSNVLYHRWLASCELRQTPPNVDGYRAAFERSLALDPNDVAARIDYAKQLEELRLMQEAREQYRIALEKNDLLGPDEPKRLSAEKVLEIREKTGSQ